MTKKEFLLELNIKIASLPEEERKEAIQYYSDFFDDCESDEKAMEELGSVEEVASKIIENFANAIATVNKKSSDDDEQTSTQTYDGLLFSFSKNKIKNLDFDFGAIEVIAIPGTKFLVETRGINPENFECRMNDSGTVIIRNKSRLANFKFWTHEHTGRFIPRILLTIPDKLTLETFRINLGAGRFECKDVNIITKESYLNVGAGNLVVKTLNSGLSNLRCMTGNLEIEGKMNGHINIDCYMGKTALQLSGNPDLYSYDAKVGLGSFEFNDFKKSGVSSDYANGKKENHFSVITGMGEVSIKIK